MNLLITTKYNKKCTLDWVEFLGSCMQYPRSFQCLQKFLARIQNIAVNRSLVTCTLLNLITKFEKKHHISNYQKKCNRNPVNKLTLQIGCVGPSVPKTKHLLRIVFDCTKSMHNASQALQRNCYMCGEPYVLNIYFIAKKSRQSCMIFSQILMSNSAFLTLSSDQSVNEKMIIKRFPCTQSIISVRCKSVACLVDASPKTKQMPL